MSDKINNQFGEKNDKVLNQKTNFWDFKTKKIYQNTGQKVLDFLFGFIGIIVISTVFIGLRLSIAFTSSSYNQMIDFIFFICFLILMFFGIYLIRTRKYIAIGTLCIIFIPLLLFGACLVILSTIGI